MKKEKNSLTIKVNKARAEATFRDRLLLLIPGSILLAGLIGIVVQEWELGATGYRMFLPAVLSLSMGLLLRWEKGWQAVLTIGLLVLVSVVCILFRQQLTESMAALLEQVAYWKLLRTGSYTMPYENIGSLLPILLLGAVGIGLGTAWILRTQSAVWQVLIAFVILAACMFGLLEGGWLLGIYLLGTLLVLARNASGFGKIVGYSGGLSLVVAVCLAGIFVGIGFTPAQTGIGSRLEEKLHAWCWESAENPLPEGKLSELGVYRPSDEPAMEVTMQHWTPLYIRGFVAGEYTEDGWEQLDTSELMERADELFVQQENCFYASNQISAAWKALEAESENAVAVKVLGACRANTYLPYGAGNITEGVLTSFDLLREGTTAPKETAYTADLYPVEDSYLLQRELADAEESSYRSAESVYRSWVYEQYVTVPEDVYEVLTKYFTANGEITTVQAMQKIIELLEQMVTYEENVLTDSGERNFPSYVLEVSRQGYSVHYATLATLLMRCCGIPARYVEGYVVTPSQAEALADGDTLTLTQSNTHAWTEYYLDGVGWLPFDATPGYSEILEYELPLEGSPTEDSNVTIHTQQILEQQEDLPVRSPNVEEEETQKSQHVYIREAIYILLLLLLLLLIAFFLRTVILRWQLRRRQRVFYSSDHRKACAGILSYIQELAVPFGIQGANLSAAEKAEQVIFLLGEGADAGALETMLNEVWFSNHAITSGQQETAMLWLEAAKRTWKQELTATKRFKQRFVTCKIL